MDLDVRIDTVVPVGGSGHASKDIASASLYFQTSSIRLNPSFIPIYASADTRKSAHYARPGQTFLTGVNKNSPPSR